MLFLKPLKSLGVSSQDEIRIHNQSRQTILKVINFSYMRLKGFLEPSQINFFVFILLRDWCWFYQSLLMDGNLVYYLVEFM